MTFYLLDAKINSLYQIIKSNNAVDNSSAPCVVFLKENILTKIIQV